MQVLNEKSCLRSLGLCKINLLITVAIIGYTRKSNYLFILLKVALLQKYQQLPGSIHQQILYESFICFPSFPSRISTVSLAPLSRTPWGNARRLKCLEGWSILAQGSSLNDTLIVYGTGMHWVPHYPKIPKTAMLSKKAAALPTTSHYFPTQSTANSRNFSNDSNSIVQLLPPVFTICNSR